MPHLRDDIFCELQIPEGAHERQYDETTAFLRDATGDTILYFYSIVSTRRSAAVKRGATVKALGLLTRDHRLSVFRAPLVRTLDEVLDSGSFDGSAKMNELFDALNSMDLGKMPRLHPHEVDLMWRGIHDGATLVSTSIAAQGPSGHTWRGECSLGGTALGLEFPLYTSPDEVVPVGDPIVLGLCSALGEAAALRVFNAIIAGKRIMVVGHGYSAQEVCNMVLGSAAMVAPPLTGILSRCFPYANLTDLSFLEVPGFIAGVTNPVFETNLAWWDLCVKMDGEEGARSATVFTSEEAATKKSGGGRAAADDSSEGQRRSDSALAARLASGAKQGLGEEWARWCFRQLATALVDLALDADCDSSTGPSYERLAAANISRVAAFRASPHAEAAFARRKNPWADLPVNEAGEGLRLSLRRAALGATLTKEATEHLFSSILHVCESEGSLQIFLNLLPEESGGVGPLLGAALLHEHAPVRDGAAELLRRLQSYSSTAAAVESMNPLFSQLLQRSGDVP